MLDLREETILVPTYGHLDGIIGWHNARNALVDATSALAGKCQLALSVSLAAVFAL